MLMLPNSPVQEHHIDFLLEEEFACNPEFLDFFVEAAKEHFKPVTNELDSAAMHPCSQWNCRAIRSVTTGKGETDVLAIYDSAETSKPHRIAVLIEDKIRAGFQPAQPERYQERGETGKKLGQWDFYWTCLISPEKYAHDNMGFDTRLSLEKLATFFSGDDQRSRFKSGVIRRAVLAAGPEMNEIMTRFRAFYVQEAASFFGEGEVNWPNARASSDFWGERWFNFKGGSMPAGAEIIHKSETGFVDLQDLTFANIKVGLLEKALARCPHPPQIIAKQTGKSASLRIHVKPISDYDNDAAAKPVLAEAFQQVRELIAFFKLNRSLLTEEMTNATQMRS